MASASWASDLVLLPWTAFMARAWPRTKGMSPTAEVGEPVPAVDALAGDDEVVPEGSDGGKKGVGPGGIIAVESDGAGVVEDDKVHGPCVEVDSAVISAAVGVANRIKVSSGPRVKGELVGYH